MGYMIFGLLAGAAFGWLVHGIRAEEDRESSRRKRQNGSSPGRYNGS